MYIKAAKYSVASAALGLGLHFFSHSYVSLERTAANHLSATKAALVSGLAEDFGYERKIELEQLTFEDLAEKEAVIQGINPALVRAVMHVESRNKQYAESNKEALGLMQVIKPNAKRCGLSHYSELFDAEKNIRCGVLILSQEMKTYKGNVFNALIAYNAGPRGVEGAWPGPIKYAQTVLNLVATDIR